MGKNQNRRDRNQPALAAARALTAPDPAGGVHGSPAPADSPPRVAANEVNPAASSAAMAAPSQPNPKLGRKLCLIGLALGLLSLAAYANSFHTGLVLDNSVVIAGDPRITAVTTDNLHLIFTRNYWWPAFESDLYRPLTTLSYLFNYAILGGGQAPTDPFGYHVLNFLLHWANVCLVLVIVRRLSGRLAVAALAAALFAVHPVNVESVTNIIGRADLLATLSILLGGWCYLRAADTTGWRKAAWLAGMGVNALWGVFAKESAVLIGAFVFLYDLFWRWPKLPEENFLRRLWLALIEFGLKGYVALLPAVVALWTVRSWLTFHSPVFGQIYVDNPISGADNKFQGFLSAIYVLGRYLALMVFPRTLSCDYSYHEIPLFGEPGAAAVDLLACVSLAVIGLLIGLAAWRWRTQPLYAWGVGIFFLMQLPTANVLFPIGSIMAERFLYLPSLGFCVMAAQGLHWLAGKLTRANVAGEISRLAWWWLFPAIAILALGVRTFARNADWQNELSLWQSAAAAEPDSFKVHKGLANALLADMLAKHKGDLVAAEQGVDAAIAEGEKGLFILDHPPLALPKQDNTLFQDMGRFYCAKGELLERRGQRDDAKTFYQKSVDVLLRARDVDHYANETSRAVSLKRGRPESEISDVGNFNVYILLDVSYEHLQDWPNAEAAGRYVQRLAPFEASGYTLVANDCANQGRLPEAAKQILEALLLNTNNVNLWQRLANYFQAMGMNPNPVSPQGNNTFSLDQSNPVVRDLLNQAGAQLVRNVEDYKQFDTASQLREKFIQNYHIPAELFERK
jgi:tetratricopeptide (TPR) repeat protein